MEKEVIINGKKFVVRELLAKEYRTISYPKFTDTEEEKKLKQEQSDKQEILISTGISADDYDKLTTKEFLTLKKELLKINVPDNDFQ